MPAATQIALTEKNTNGACCAALFASGLQPSDAPTADVVATAISLAVKQFGIRGCVARMAQEFGDHPDTAAVRMRWARQLIAATRPTARTARIATTTAWSRSTSSGYRVPTAPAAAMARQGN